MQQVKKKTEANSQKQKKQGGWFSCFSNSTVDYSSQNMISQEQKAKNEARKNGQQWDNDMNQHYGQPDLYDQQYGSQKKPLQAYGVSTQEKMKKQQNSKANYMPVKPYNSQTSDLNKLRYESKMRLQHNQPYKPDTTQSQTASRNRTPVKSVQSLSYYTGGPQQTAMGRSGSDSNLRVGHKLTSYTPKRASISNLLNTSGVKDSNMKKMNTYGQDVNNALNPSAMLNAPAAVSGHTKVTYTGRPRSNLREKPINTDFFLQKHLGMDPIKKAQHRPQLSEPQPMP